MNTTAERVRHLARMAYWLPNERAEIAEALLAYADSLERAPNEPLTVYGADLASEQRKEVAEAGNSTAASSARDSKSRSQSDGPAPDVVAAVYHHARDFAPGTSARERERGWGTDWDKSYRTLAYVKAQCRELAQQLAALARSE